MRKSILNFAKIAVFIVACYFVYTKVFSDGGLDNLSQIVSRGKEGNFSYFLLILLLMPINWILEAVKWKLLLRRISEVNLKDSIWAILIGTYYSLVTPNRIGDGIGKLSILTKEKRKQGAYAFFTGSISQLSVTLIAGCLAFGILDINLLPNLSPIYRNLFFTTLIVMSLFMVLAYLLPNLRKKLAVIFGKKIKDEFIVPYDVLELQSFISLSAIRYLIFSSQFVLSLLFFGVSISISNAFFAVALVYLISAIIPTFILGELGVRESAALLVMIPLGGDETGIFAATFFLWLVNLLLPSAVGALIHLSSPKKVSP